MSDVKKIATRETYGKTLVEQGAEMPNLVVLDADLAGATKTGVFKKAYPDRHIDCGIAESNMMSIAAGLAAAGMVPFASTFAMFAAGRAFEQVRNSIGYPHLNVKTGKVVTAEEHNIIGGLGGAVAECLAEKCPTRMYRIGVRDKFGESASAAELLHKYMLDGEGVYKQVKAFVEG